MSTVERAIAIAAEAHAGQVDKAGQPYILHPLRVMMAVQTPAERIVAVLHDVAEDCPAWNLERIAGHCFSAPVMLSLTILTKPKGVRYQDYIDLCGERALTRSVKIADLRDNSDPVRLALVPRELDRLRLEMKYAAALVQLGATR